MVVAYLRDRLPTLDADVLLVNCGLHDIKTTAPGPSSLYYDHVHFNVEVRALQAAFIAGWLEGQEWGANR